MVSDEFSELPVLLYQASLSGADVYAVELMELGRAIVEADDNLVGKIGAHRLNLGPDPAQRGQVPSLPHGEVDAVGVPVLVAALVLQVEDVPIRVLPEIDTYASDFVVSDRHSGGRIVGGTDPNIEHAIDRRQVGQSSAVGAQGGQGPVGIAKKDFTRDQRAGLLVRHSQQWCP